MRRILRGACLSVDERAISQLAVEVNCSLSRNRIEEINAPWMGMRAESLYSEATS